MKISSLSLQAHSEPGETSFAKERYEFRKV